MQGTGVADYAGILHMVVFRYEITDSVVSVRYRLKILYQGNQKYQKIHSQKEEKKVTDNTSNADTNSITAMLVN